jgi:hypothetical protein
MMAWNDKGALGGSSSAGRSTDRSSFRINASMMFYPRQHGLVFFSGGC